LCEICNTTAVFVNSGISPSGGSGFEEVDPDDCVTMVQLAIQKCLEREALCNEFYLQLIKQTTDQPDPNGRINIQNWRFLCLICGVVVPRNQVILNYLHAHLRRCGIDSHTEEGKFAQFASQVREIILSNKFNNMNELRYLFLTFQCSSRTHDTKNRKYPPSYREVQCIIRRYHHNYSYMWRACTWVVMFKSISLQAANP
jgi:myosin-7